MTYHFSKQNGSAIIYILIAIALLAALTTSLMSSPSQQTQSQNRMKTLAEIKSQIDLIRASIEECVLMNPGGDNTIDTTAGAMDEGASIRYPIRPDSDHLPAAIRESDRLVRHLRCPGNPGDDPNHAAMFAGESGKYLPPAPSLFEDWQWYNGKDGIFFWTETSNTDAFIRSALEKLDQEYGQCEADIIDATGGSVSLESGTSTVSCSSNHVCFRVWVVTKSSALFPDEAGCP